MPTSSSARPSRPAGDLRECARGLAGALELCRIMGDQAAEAGCVACIAYVLRELGDLAAGARAPPRADRRAQGQRRACVADGIARVHPGMRGELGPARRNLTAGLDMARRLDMLSMQVDAAAALALVDDYDSDRRRRARPLPLPARALGGERGPPLRDLGPATRGLAVRPGGAARTRRTPARRPSPDRLAVGARARTGGARPRAGRDALLDGRARNRRGAVRARGGAAPRPAHSCRAGPDPRRAGVALEAAGEREHGGRALRRGLPARPPTWGRARSPAGPRRRWRSSASRPRSGSAAPPPTARRRPLTAARLEVCGWWPAVHQPRDRRRPLPQPAHGGHARAQHPGEARLRSRVEASTKAGRLGLIER